ncbi:unnamed protein product, partial [marine sediment metagenome]
RIQRVVYIAAWILYLHIRRGSSAGNDQVNQFDQPVHVPPRLEILYKIVSDDQPGLPGLSYHMLEKELGTYSEELTRKPRLVVGTK